MYIYVCIYVYIYKPKPQVVTASNFKLCQHQWRVFDDAGVGLRV